MGLFEKLKEAALRAEYERLKLLDKAEQQNEDIAMQIAKFNRGGKDVRPQDLEQTRQMLQFSEDMASGVGTGRGIRAWPGAQKWLSTGLFAPSLRRQINTKWTQRNKDIFRELSNIVNARGKQKSIDMYNNRVPDLFNDTFMQTRQSIKNELSNNRPNTYKLPIMLNQVTEEEER